MKISVIIPFDIKRSSADLDGLKCEVYQQMADLDLEGEILVESDGSKSSARNTAVQKATGEILVFLDDDVQLRRGFLLEILEPFQHENVGIVGGVNVAFQDQNLWEEISSVMMSSPVLWGRSSARYTPRGGTRITDEAELISCCMAVRKEAFLEAGGFPLDVIPCEENVLINRIIKLGWIAIYNPHAVVFHRRAEFPGGYARKLFGYGMGRGLMMRKGLRSGAPKFIWKPRFRWIYYVLGIVIHFSSYFLGVLYGYLIKNRLRRDEEK